MSRAPTGRAEMKLKWSITSALDELAAVPVLVVDEQLRVTAATPGAAHVLGEGACMDLSSPLGSTGTLNVGGRTIAYRATPLRDAERSIGYLLFLDEQPPAADEELFHGMWTADPGMKRVFRTIEKIAPSDSIVLLRGETGSGKELVAHAVHLRSSRSKGPFRVVNCRAIPQHLLESEMFGHVRGAFPGAVRSKPGEFRAADQGTIFLDGIAELPLELQAKLLHVLDTRAITPVGGRAPVPVDVRLIASTNRPLRKDVEIGRFRADLMYRLRVVPILIPSLRDRGRDIELLVEKLILELNTRSHREIQGVSPAARSALARYGWPGNVRELRSAIEYAYAIGDGDVLAVADLPPEIAVPEQASDGAPSRHDAAAIIRALERARGSRARAAELLGMSRVTLWRRMRDLGLSQR